MRKRLDGKDGIYADGDGDLDAVIGDYAGDTRLFLNTPLMDADSLIITPAPHDNAAAATSEVVIVFPEAIEGGTYGSDSIKVWGSLTGNIAGSFLASGKNAHLQPNHGLQARRDGHGATDHGREGCQRRLA